MERPFKGKELIVRKRMAAFMEKLLRYCGFDFRHDLYKQIVYAETEYRTPFEEKVKNYYDAYVYLLYNHANPFSQSIVKRFFYLINEKEPEESFLIRLTTKFFKLGNRVPIEHAVEFHLYVFSELGFLDKESRLIVSLMFFNYTLVKRGIPSVHFVRSKLQKYEECREKYFTGDKSAILVYMTEIVQSEKMQNKSYYKELSPLNTNDIYYRLLNDKEMLQTRFGVHSLYIFGSFPKGIQRIDSDIDLLIEFSQDLSFDERKNKAEEIEMYYEIVFNRFVDITEITQYIGDEIIKEITRYQKII